MKYLPIFILLLMAYCSEQDEPVTQRLTQAQQEICTDTIYDTLIYYSDTLTFYDTVEIYQPPTGGGPQPIPCIVWDSVTYYVMDTVCTNRPDTLNNDG